jgi:hypothetical protein
LVKAAIWPLSGFDNVSDTSVELYADDVLRASGLANIPRPDVALACLVLPSMLPSTSISTPHGSSMGQHTIEVRAKDAACNIGLLPLRIITILN